MTQEAITEIELDVFSRRIKPYFTWLESKIESGWEQSDTVRKDVLQETKMLLNTMRARFILGVRRDEFTNEVKKALEHFELALDAFPGESDEIESKMQHLCKGIQGELGAEFLPDGYAAIKEEKPKRQASIRPVAAPEVRITIEQVKEETKKEKPDYIKSEQPKTKVKRPAKKKKQNKARPKKEKSKTQKPTKKKAKKKSAKKSEKKKQPVKKDKTTKRKTSEKTKGQSDESKEQSKPQRSSKLRNSTVKKWLKKFIYG